MSKRSEKYNRHLEWLKHRQEKIERHRRKKRKYGTNRIVSVGLRYTSDTIIIDFPKIIDLYDKYRCRETLDFFNREFIDIGNYPNGIIFNFLHTRKITLSGGIITRCFFDFLNSKKARISFENITSDKVKQILCHIGLLPEVKMTITYEDIYRWHIQSWDKTQTTRKKLKMDLISAIIKETTGWGERTTKHKRLYEIIPETLFNCIEHAYNGTEDFQKFYLFSGIANDNYVFCVLDRGMGFRATYEKRMKEFLRFDDMENDGDYIRFSIDQDHSSILKEGRGNGLSTFKENILELGGHIFIHSYKGKVVVFPQKRDIQSENRYPLVGSLLQFSIPKR
ncbi:hypothetical protein FACS1894163_04560 [Spirochaetia bacterium]|nr:hypothetical protein FACS1894163_04560 [Spirochaetia bacterium]